MTKVIEANIQKSNGVYNAYDGEGNFIASAQTLNALNNHLSKTKALKTQPVIDESISTEEENNA